MRNELTAKDITETIFDFVQYQRPRKKLGEHTSDIFKILCGRYVDPDIDETHDEPHLPVVYRTLSDALNLLVASGLKKDGVVYVRGILETSIRDAVREYTPPKNIRRRITMSDVTWNDDEAYLGVAIADTKGIDMAHACDPV